MRKYFIAKLLFKLKTLCFLIPLFLCLSPAFAYGDINIDESKVLLLVGVRAQEIADNERGIFQGKKVIEIPRTDNWQSHVSSHGASEVILKQNTGFVGLYSASGFLIRPVQTIDDVMNPLNTQNSGPSYPDQVQRVAYQQYVYNPYSTGGIPNPYVLPPTAEPRNNARLAPGWGYNTQIDKPASKRSIAVDFLNFVPIDVVTPLNYPGYFDQTGLTTAYGLGVIPHIGGLIARVVRGKADRSDYEYYRAQGPGDSVEYPVQYYNNPPGESPFIEDPNFMRYQQMPYAFEQDYPGYGQPNQGFGGIYTPSD